MAFIPRLTAPTDFTTCYTERRLPAQPSGTETLWQYFYSGDYSYSMTGAHTGNCTWYAMGRSSEIAGVNLYDQFRGSYEAGNWTNIWIGNPAQTSGPIDYHLGDILIYSGHVEIVEEINGNTLTISYSAYSSYNPQSQYGTFFGVRYRQKMDFGDPASDSGDPSSRFTRNNGQQYYLNEPLIGIIHNPYVDDDPPIPPDPPTPVTTPVLVIDPASYTATMTGNQQYIDFTFDIEVTGIPAGEVASGGNTYPGLIRIYNTSWHYDDYTVGGVTYRRANKRETLRYLRESIGAYTITKYMYYAKTWTNGSVSQTVPMYITVEASSEMIAIITRILKDRRERRAHIHVV